MGGIDPFGHVRLQVTQGPGSVPGAPPHAPGRHFGGRVAHQVAGEAGISVHEAVQGPLHRGRVTDRVRTGTFTAVDGLDRPPGLDVASVLVLDHPGGLGHGRVHQAHQRVLPVHIDHQEVQPVGRVQLDEREVGSGPATVRERLVFGLPTPEVLDAVMGQKPPHRGRHGCARKGGLHM